MWYKDKRTLRQAQGKLQTEDGINGSSGIKDSDIGVVGPG